MKFSGHRRTEKLIDYPRTLIRLFCMAAPWSLNHTVHHLRVDTDTTRILCPNPPFQNHHRRLIEALPQDDQAILLALGAPTPELATHSLRWLDRSPLFFLPEQQQETAPSDHFQVV